MLNKKQYFIALGTGVTVFFVIFISSYLISYNTKDGIMLPAQKVMLQKEEDKLKNIDRIESDFIRSNKLTILPSTKVTLAFKDINNNQIQSVILDTTTLLGNTRETLEHKFEDYAIETFSESEVKLVKMLDLNEALVDNQNHEYVLSIDKNKLCIKDKTTGNISGYIDRNVSDLSSYLYSEFLKENIKVTSDEREKLLVDGSFLQIILQDYESE